MWGIDLPSVVPAGVSGWGIPLPKVTFTGPPPENTVAPYISIAGDTLTCNDGTWSGESVTISRQWTKDGAYIDGATSPTYVVPSDGVCATYACVVTASNPAGSASLTSNGIYVGLLDILGETPSLAVSLRRLSSAYTGPLIRVRRSSDNAEQDIGYASNGKLDTAAVLSFVGASDGFVTTWYSQSGAINAVQATTTLQPTIALAGVINTTGAFPMVMSDGVDDRMDLGTGFQVDGGFTVNAVARIMVSTGFPRIVSKWNNISVSGDWLLAPSSTNASRFGVREGTTNKIASIVGPAVDFNGLHIHTGIMDLANVTSYYDSVYSASLAMLGSPLPSSAAAVCLFKDTHPSTAAAKMGIVETMIFQSALSTAKRNIIEGSQAACLNA